jgi:hypothetical protein
VVERSEEAPDADYDGGGAAGSSAEGCAEPPEETVKEAELIVPIGIQGLYAANLAIVAVPFAAVGTAVLIMFGFTVITVP